ncbi:GNAT family N-acetyltransferase [Streptomyces sp. HNM0574]|nr:GNAT family N-acetyltransferase [Streptomyces sp. HNM0574]
MRSGWFRNLSTRTGTHGAYPELPYVRPAARGAGPGGALLSALARICAERGYERLEWWVLDWNKPSVDRNRSPGTDPHREAPAGGRRSGYRGNRGTRSPTPTQRNRKRIDPPDP